MANEIELDENSEKFLIEVYNRTKGDAAAKVSMSDIGASFGMDKTASSRTAEILIGWELLAVKTLSGGIGITEEGVAEAKKRGAGSGEESAIAKLGDAPVITADTRKGIEQVAADLKSRSSKLNLDFDALTELIADIKTIEIQLTSPRPKTAVIRESFRSVMEILKKVNATESLTQVKKLLGE